MNYILFDGPHREDLLPLVFTRPVADIRLGILTIREKWEHFLKTTTSTLTEEYLGKKFPVTIKEDNLLVNGSVLPNSELISQITRLKTGQKLVIDKFVIAMRLNAGAVKKYPGEEEMESVDSDQKFVHVKNTWDIFSFNSQAIEDDFELLTTRRSSQEISKTNFIIGDPDKIFIEKGAVVEYAFLNTTDGPIYIGKDAQVMEGAKIRGSFALCEHSTLKMDAKIYSGTTVGPHCKVGGEVQNVVFFGYSNKGHDGYLGNAVVGEWCNFGADSNNSNLKNTYDSVKLWSYAKKHFVNTGLQFCGLIMGDHSKTGINTMFNTGTVVGVFCNLFGSGYQRNFIPSFSWGGPHGMKTFNLEKSFVVAKAVMDRRHIDFDQVEKEILTHIYTNTSTHRK